MDCPSLLKWTLVLCVKSQTNTQTHTIIIIIIPQKQVENNMQIVNVNQWKVFSLDPLGALCLSACASLRYAY